MIIITINVLPVAFIILLLLVPLKLTHNYGFYVPWHFLFVILSQNLSQKRNFPNSSYPVSNSLQNLIRIH